MRLAKIDDSLIAFQVGLELQRKFVRACNNIHVVRCKGNDDVVIDFGVVLIKRSVISTADSETELIDHNTLQL